MKFKDIIQSRSRSAREDHWIPLADLMTGLMILFMLIAVSFMLKVEAEASQAKDIAAREKRVAIVYDKMRNELYRDLYKEFKNDLPRWKAELDRDLTVRFKEPEVLFDTGQASLKPRFSDILSDFFPRYIRILSSHKYRDSIEEIRIEGHTSSVWDSVTTPDEAYFKNMELSQARTRTTLRFVFGIPEMTSKANWLKAHLTANGLSSSKLVLTKTGEEDALASQRVEFRVRTDADRRIAQILQVSRR